MLPWKWGIIREKISLVTFLCHDKNGQAGRLATEEAQENWKHGLIQEARKLCQDLDLPDPCSVRICSETIGERVKEAARAEMWESIVTAKYVRDEVKDENNFPGYMYDETLSNHQQKIIFCYRLGLLEFKSRYKAKFTNTRCIYNGCEEEDSLEHSFYCEKNPVRRPAGTEWWQMVEYLEQLHLERVRAVGLPLYYL